MANIIIKDYTLETMNEKPDMGKLLDNIKASLCREFILKSFFDLDVGEDVRTRRVIDALSFMLTHTPEFNNIEIGVKPGNYSIEIELVFDGEEHEIILNRNDMVLEQW